MQHIVKNKLMATNKNALIRYKVLDRCFRNPGKRYFINDLIAECESMLLERDPNSNGISRRQIYEDISYMESKEGWEIELARLNDGRKRYYQYEDTSYSINNMPLNEVEINQLKSAVDILTQFKGMPQFEWINELVPKLSQGISSVENTTTVIEFDSNQYLKGIEHLGDLHNAIFYKKVLSLSYHPFGSEVPYEIVLHPYFLKQYNNRWFLFGYNPENQKYDWNLALDRIVSFEEIGGKYEENTSIKWDEYFDDIIGVTKPIDVPVEKVVLHFYGKAGHYVETKPVHGSQKRPKWLDDNTAEITLSVMINYELESLILSYAENVKIIQPQSLIDRLKNRLSTALKQYK